MRVVFLHPDLGIGGAERLVVDAALALLSRGHEVTVVTNHHDPSHCFPETRTSQLPVIVVGDWIPRSILGKCHALMAYLRMIYAALWLGLAPSAPIPDLIHVDQISACIPILNLFLMAHVLFYCHFPDQLLTDRKTALKRAYRAILDYIEECTTGMADLVLVNSKFTEAIFQRTFPRLLNKVHTAVLYPSLNSASFKKKPMTADISTIADFGPNIECYFLSINRFERKKNLGLSLKALKELYLLLEEFNRKVGLIIAGGYDPNLTENKEYFAELVEEAKELGIESSVRFIKSPEESVKIHLIHSCLAVIYTPENEHFGIVPLEAMYLSRPVIAANSGGPLETIIHQDTGILCDPTPAAFADAMKKFFENRHIARDMGVQGHKHVKHSFSFDVFSHRLDGLIQGLRHSKKVHRPMQAFIYPTLFLLIILCSVFIVWIFITYCC